MRVIDWIRVCAALIVTGVGAYFLWRALFAEGPIEWWWALGQALVGCYLLFDALRSARRHKQQGASPPQAPQT